MKKLTTLDGLAGWLIKFGVSSPELVKKFCLMESLSLLIVISLTLYDN